MTNFFAQPQIPRVLNPEPAGFDTLRTMLEGNAAQLNANPYGFNPNATGASPLNPYAGQGQFNPYTGGWTGGSGIPGTVASAGPPGSYNPGIIGNTSAGAGMMNGPSGISSGGGINGNFLQMLQSLMAGQGGAMTPGGGSASQSVNGGKLVSPPPVRGRGLDGVKYDATIPEGAVGPWSYATGTSGVWGPATGGAAAPGSTPAPTTTPPPATTSAGLPAHSTGTVPFYGSTTPAPTTTTTTPPAPTSLPTQPPAPTPAGPVGFNPTATTSGTTGSTSGTAAPETKVFDFSSAGGGPQFWRSGASGGYDAAPAAPPSAMDQLISFLGKLFMSKGATPPAAADRKGVDIKEMMQRADNIANNNAPPTPTPTPAPSYDGGLGGPIQMMGNQRVKPRIPRGKSDATPIGGNDLGNGSLRSYDAAYAGIKMPHMMMPRPVRTPSMIKPSVTPIRAVTPSSTLNNLIGGMSHANRFGQSTAFRTQMGHTPVYDALPPTNPARMAIAPVSRGPLPTATGADVTPAPAATPGTVTGSTPGTTASVPSTTAPTTNAQTAGAPMYPWLMPYSGNLTAPMSGAQNQALGSMGSFMNSGMGLQPAQSYLNTELSGGNMAQANPYMNQIVQGLQQQQAIQDPLALAKISSSMAAGGDALSGANAAAQGQYLASSNANLNQNVGNLQLQNLMQQQGLQSQAANQSMNLANTEMGGLGQLMNAGAVPQQTQQNAYTSAYNDWLRQMGGMQGQSQLGNNLALNTLKTSPQSSAAQYQPNSQASSLLGALGMLGGSNGLLTSLFGNNNSSGGLLGQLGNLLGIGNSPGYTNNSGNATGGYMSPIDNSSQYGPYSSGGTPSDVSDFMTNLEQTDPALYQYFAEGGT